MHCMDCKEIKVPDNLIIYCRQEDDAKKVWLFKCFFELFFNDFRNFFRGYCVSNSIIYSVDEQLTTAFGAGQWLFYRHIREKGWEECGASVRTALFTYCFNQLRALTKSLRNHPGNQFGGDPNLIIESKSESLSHQTDTTAEEVWDDEYELFKKAFDKLDPKCRDFIYWRKLNEISDAEIKARYPDVDFGSRDPTDKAHRCVGKLRKIIDKLNGKN